MNPVIEPTEPHDDDRAALLVDPRARSDATLDDEVAAAHRGARERAAVSVDDDDAGHHVLAGRPADPARDVDLRAVDEAAGEVAERALEADLAAAEDADAERVAPLRVLDDDLVDALLVEEAAELEVDRARRQLTCVERRDAVLDDRRARRLRDGLGEPARVVRDLPLAYRCHTRTSRS